MQVVLTEAKMLTVQWMTQEDFMDLRLLTLAFLLTAVIGLERQYRLKAAGLRTHTLVGIGSALFTLVSVHGFGGLSAGSDPSRIAAQVVSGIGFLGAGVIFVRQESVSGLTTAASIWVTAAIGVACGAQLPLLAVFATFLYLCAVGPLAIVTRRWHGHLKSFDAAIRYLYSESLVYDVTSILTQAGYSVSISEVRRISDPKEDLREVIMTLSGAQSHTFNEIVAVLSVLPGISSITRIDSEHD